MDLDTNDLEYTGFWLRVWASLIDTVIIVACTAPLLTAIYGRAYWSTDDALQGGWDFVITWLLPAAAVLAFWIARQATPGKMAIGARILDADTGEPPSGVRLVVRYVGYFVSAIPLGLGLIWVAFDPRKQGWHDKLANTVVVRPKRGGRQPVRFRV